MRASFDPLSGRSARLPIELVALTLALLVLEPAVHPGALAAPAIPAARSQDDPFRRKVIECLRATAPAVAERMEAALRDPVMRGADGARVDEDAAGRHQPPDTFPARVTDEWIPLVLPARFGHAMVMDESRHRLLIVGGKSHGAVWGDAWEVALDGSPSPRRISDSWSWRFGPDGSVVHDTRHDRLIAYGGAREGPVDAAPGSWAADDRAAVALSLSGGGTWRPLTALYQIDETIPAPRHDHVAIYDPLRDRMLVFGGMSYDELYGWLDVQHPRTDLWELSLGSTPEWNEIAQTGDVPHRPVGSAVCEGAADAMWYVADGFLWRLDLATARWDSLPVPGPRPAARGKLAFDAAARRLYCFAEGELWSMDLHAPWTWVHRDLPGDRPDAGAIAWDGGSGRLYAFSGAVGDPPTRRAAPSILWSIAPEKPGIAWERAFDGRVPGAVLSAGVYDARRDRLVAVDRMHALNGVYELRSGAVAWRALSLPAGLESYLFSLVLDETHDRMLMIGAQPGDAYPRTWGWNLAADDGWFQIGPADDGIYSLGWDAGRQRVVRFGWTAEDAPIRVQWLDGGIWRSIVSVGDAPSFRALPSVASDPDRGRLFVLGGVTETYPNYVDRRWTLELGDSARWTAHAFYDGYDAWNVLFLPMAYDPVHHSLVLHGMYGVGAGWRYEGTVERVDTPPVTGGGSLPASTDEFLTPVRQLNGLVYDGHRDRLITYGGTSWRQTPADTLIDAYALSFEKPRRTIRVDLRPNAGSDKVNPSSHEAVQVAALSDANFDARQLDLATVYVAGVPVRHDGGGRPIFTVRDVDGDGREDIVVHFDAHDLPITEANVAVKLWGHTFDDVPVEGIAAVQVHVPGQGPVDQTGQADVHNAPAFEIALAPDGVAFQCRLANLPGARVELFDVNGRRLASAAGGTSATHSLTLTPPSRPAPGLYFARLTGPATLTRKVFVLR